ncbi:MAG: hypothetical protein RLZZ169_2072, partial [Pseudomonadota bacterium]|jgi:hypothetical protein
VCSCKTPFRVVGYLWITCELTAATLSSAFDSPVQQIELRVLAELFRIRAPF